MSPLRSFDYCDLAPQREANRAECGLHHGIQLGRQGRPWAGRAERRAGAKYQVSASLHAHQTFSSFAWTSRRACRWMALHGLLRRFAAKLARGLPEKGQAVLRIRTLTPALCTVDAVSALEGIAERLLAALPQDRSFGKLTTPRLPDYQDVQTQALGKIPSSLRRTGPVGLWKRGKAQFDQISAKHVKGTHCAATCCGRSSAPASR